MLNTFWSRFAFDLCAILILVALVGGFLNWADPSRAATAEDNEQAAQFSETTFKSPFIVTHSDLLPGSYGEPISTDCYRKVVWVFNAEGAAKEVVTTLPASRFIRVYDVQANGATIEFIVRGPAISQALINENPNNVLCNPKYSVTGIIHMNIEEDPDDYSFTRDQGPPPPSE